MADLTNENFRDIVTKYEKLVFTVCYQMVRNYHDAQNLTQDTFLSAYTHIEHCRDETLLKPWLTRIAANKAKDFLKSAYQRRVQPDDEKLLRFEAKGTPDKTFLEKEGAEEIVTLIHSLKEPYLKVSELYFLQERTTEEISKLLGRPKKTVQTQLLRAKHQLQKMISEEVKV